MWWFSGRGVVWVGLDRCGPALPVPVCAWSVGLRGFGGEVEDPYARVGRGRCRYLGRTGVSACRCLRVPGVVGVAHSRAFGVGGNRGIMRNSKVSSGRGPAPMCTGPLIAHGSPTTTHDAHRKSLQFQRKPAPPPRRGPGLLCAISRTTAPTRHIRLPHNQSTTNSYRNSTDSQRGVWCVRTSETVRVSQMW